MQSLPYSNEIPYTISNGIQRSKNLKIFNGFTNDSSILYSSKTLMDVKDTSANTIYNNTLAHLAKSNENELTRLSRTPPDISFNLTEFIANRIEKSLQENNPINNITYTNVDILSDNLMTPTTLINHLPCDVINDYKIGDAIINYKEEPSLYGMPLNAQIESNKPIDIVISSGSCVLGNHNPSTKFMQELHNVINNNKLTKVVAKTIYPINPPSIYDNTSPIHITHKNSIFPTLRKSTNNEGLLYTQTFKEESQAKKLNLHCSELMDDANILIPKHDNSASTTTIDPKLHGEQQINDTSSQAKQISTHSGFVQDMNKTKGIDNLCIAIKGSNNNNAPSCLPTHTKDNNPKENCKVYSPISSNHNKYGVLSLPQKNFNLNVSLNNNILPSDDMTKKCQPRAYMSAHNFRSPGSIVGINAKEFQHLIFMNHKNQNTSTINPFQHLPTTSYTTMQNNNTVVTCSETDMISSPKTTYLPKFKNNAPSPLGIINVHKSITAYAGDVNQSPKFALGSNTKYASSYNYLTSPPQGFISLSSTNSQNSSIPNIKSSSNQQLLSPTTLIVPNFCEHKLPYSILTTLKPTLANTQDYPQLISSNQYQCNLVPKNSFYQVPPPITLFDKGKQVSETLKAMQPNGIIMISNNFNMRRLFISYDTPIASTHQIQNKMVMCSTSSNNLLKSPLSLNLALSPLSHLSVSPRKKQPRKQNLTINKRGPEADIDTYSRCIDIDGLPPVTDQYFKSFNPSNRMDQIHHLDSIRSTKYVGKKSKDPSSNFNAIKKYKDKRKLANDTDNATTTSLLPSPDHNNQKLNGPYSKLWKSMMDGLKYKPKSVLKEHVITDINEHLPFNTLLECATVLSPTETDHLTKDRFGKLITDPLYLSKNKSLYGKATFKRASDRHFDNTDGRKDPASSKVKNKKERTYLTGKKIKCAPNRTTDTSALNDSAIDDLKTDDFNDNLEPKYYVDEEGIRWKILADHGSASSNVPKITDNNSFYQNYKSGLYGPQHHFLRPEDVKPKDNHSSNSTNFTALELAITTYLNESANPSSTNLQLPNLQTDKVKDLSSKLSTWKLLHLTTRLDYIIFCENQHIKYLRHFKEALFNKKLVNRMCDPQLSTSPNATTTNSSNQNVEPIVVTMPTISKYKLQSEYLNHYLLFKSDPDVKLYELIMASLQRSMYIKNELLESKKLLLTSLTTEFQYILLNGVHNLLQLNNGFLPSRITSASTSGPLYNLLCSVAKKSKDELKELVYKFNHNCIERF